MTSYDIAWWQAHPEHMQEQRNGPQAWAYEAQEAAIADVLRPLGGINSVLEVGCGYGRVTKIVYDALRPAIYTATDVSPEALEQAREHTRSACSCFSEPQTLDARAENGHRFSCDVERPIVFKALDLADFQRDPADLVVASEVLMHRPPSQVIYDAEMLAQHARRYVLTVDWHEDSDRKAEGCYQHDYAALFGKYGFVNVIPLPKIRQAIFLTAIA